ncbi:MAG: ABC transporter substrate-binding protein [Xanthomonadales bacterium]|nr:ABC transporter substrate-binding protein [Xanthomonadales bacterium]NIN60027.1 ABC transporter substrate-binding protein [Xanthomonadales bacterium]NIN75395.1 ABC transporter substrate-binding protein [Xanthomonadales bacterium]NIO14218.1 ABC transporter substrate-binding protein [Xanthomonadales bacterium]NIP12420.1 ABC transporter substrate-binding protein [Xanthomonadales bacterium]
MKTPRTGILLACAWLAATPLPASSHLDDPAQLVSDTAGRILTRLNENHAQYHQRPELLKDVVREDLLPLLDVRYAGRLILGRSGRDASAEQLDAFTEAMSNLLINRYAEGLLQFRSEEQLEVLPLRGELNERMTRVRTRVRLESGGFAPVDYVFRRTDGGWKAFDVVVEGISYVTTYRNQIMPEVQAEGLDAVIARLNQGQLVLSD